MFNLFSLKVFSSIYDPYKHLFSLWKKWSHVQAAPAIFGPKLKQKVHFIHSQVFTVVGLKILAHVSVVYHVLSMSSGALKNHPKQKH